MGKQNDFNKVKLKVGKHGKNGNEYNINSKKIIIATQSIHKQKTDDSILLHQISLLSHKNTSVKKEALGYLIKYDVPGAYLGSLLEKICALISHSERAIRLQVLALLNTINQDISPFANYILLYIHAAMTNISPSVKKDSLKFMNWLMHRCQVVRYSWGRSIECFIDVYGWNSSMSSLLDVSDYEVFHAFVKQGIIDQDEASLMISFCSAKHMIPKRPNPYGFLNLFFKTASSDSAEERRAFLLQHTTTINKGIHQMKSAGGAIGRLGKEIGVLLQPINPV